MANATSNSTALVMMVPWLHFSGGDHLLFRSWHPSSKAAIAGASLGLLFFALCERWLAAMRAVMEAHWRRNSLALISRCDLSSLHASPSEGSEKPTEGENDQSVNTESPPPSHTQRNRRLFAPFVPAHDLPRGALHAVQALLGYTLMLSVMTFQAAFIISIIAGLGIGEMLFGRLGSAHSRVLH